MAIISRKKLVFRIAPALREYLSGYSREFELPLQYTDLILYDNAVPLYAKNGRDTLWETVFYPASEAPEIYENLKRIYADLKANGDVSVMQHLHVDRVDVCTYGNTKPFRVRIVNQVNDNFDYFYIKIADASRVYGLELEHLLSPNRISYLTFGQTLIEEHIAGIPGDEFLRYHLSESTLNPIRLSKEFVKFTERCFVQLLGDMHSANFVVVTMPDFEDVHYRLRAIDFDQQSYEARRSVYQPQYFKQNNLLIELGMKFMTMESVRQYQIEERSLIANRLRTERQRIQDLLSVMIDDTISTPANTESLRNELARYYRNSAFLRCRSMGEIVKTSLELVLTH
ncbi:MAG: hypothetical protein LH606_20595 [Cytophagaceae bacterium]|nr:hypothetical protein [Cytophagaceae bacterium]